VLESDQDHGGIPVPVPVRLGGLDARAPEIAGILYVLLGKKVRGSEINRPAQDPTLSVSSSSLIWADERSGPLLLGKTKGFQQRLSRLTSTIW
jgi:hypothetical protein